MAGRDPGRIWRTFAVTFSFGFTLAAGLWLGYAAGSWLDRRWGTEPWLALAGVALGVAAAFRALLRALRAVNGGGGRVG